MTHAEGSVVVCAEVVRPVLGAVYTVADSIRKAFAEAFAVGQGENGVPKLGAVISCFVVAQRRILPAVPVVSGVSDKYILVISVVLQNSVDLVVAQIPSVTESLGSYGSTAAEYICVGVILAVVVVPDFLTVSNILDSELGVEAAGIVEMGLAGLYTLRVSYGDYDKVMRLARDTDVAVSDSQFEEEVTLSLIATDQAAEAFSDKLRELTRGSKAIELISKQYYPLKEKKVF